MRTRLDYFYGEGLHQFLFYRMPKALFNQRQYLGISFEARAFYPLLLDRMSLSVRSGWTDNQNRVYIYYTLREAMKVTNYGHNKMVRIFNELEQMGLIERMRQGQGKPVRIYVKDFDRPLNEAGEPLRTEAAVQNVHIEQELKSLDGQMSLLPEMESLETFAEAVEKEETRTAPAFYVDRDCAADPAATSTPVMEDKSSAARQSPASGDTQTDTLHCPAAADTETPEIFMRSQKGKSGLPETGSQGFPKSERNKNNKNHNDFSETDPSYPPAPMRSLRRYGSEQRSMGMDEIDRCKEEIRLQIGYEHLKETYALEMQQVDDYVDLIADVMCSQQHSMFVSRAYRPIAQIQRQFSKLTYEHIAYVLDSMSECKTRITNVQSYLLTTLYNAPSTIRTYYDARVRHDMAQDDWRESYGRAS